MNLTKKQVKEINKVRAGCEKLDYCVYSTFSLYNRLKIDVPRRQAAILVPLYFFNNEWYIIFTKRTNHLPYHSGEISFPGGSREKHDSSKKETALRETEEEIGIPGKAMTILGKLDDQLSVADINVTPYVAKITDHNVLTHMKPQENEVEEIFQVPLQFFYRKSTSWQENWIRNKQPHKVYFYNFNGRIIWGLTARVVKNLIEILEFCNTCEENSSIV